MPTLRADDSHGLSTPWLRIFIRTTFAHLFSSERAIQMPSNEFPRGSTQPIDLLRRLAGARLPVRISDDTDVETLRILKLGGTIKAAIPDAPRVPGGLSPQGQTVATVSEITKVGRRMLDLFAGRQMSFTSPASAFVGAGTLVTTS